MFIAVAMGGPSPEHDISCESGASVVRALSTRDHVVEPLTIGRDGSFTFQDVCESPVESTRSMLAAGVDAVFLALHGRGGEDGYIQAWLEWAGIPYTGSDMPASALAINKCTFKAMMVDRGLPTPRHLTILRSDWQNAKEAVLREGQAGPGFPAMIKVATAGSSFGVLLVRNENEAYEALDRLTEDDDMVLWESCVQGDELTVPVYSGLDGVLHALPVILIVPQKGEFFNLASKYDEGGAQEIVPAPIADKLADELTRLALECHLLSGCRGVSRTDFMVGAEGPMILEINTTPGLTPASLLPKAIDAAGIEAGKFYEDLALDAMNRELLYRMPRDVQTP